MYVSLALTAKLNCSPRSQSIAIGYCSATHTDCQIYILLYPCSCFGYCYPNQLEMERVRNEDLCMIIIDRGAMEDHLPNHVLAALQRFKRQSLGQSYREAEVERLREEAWREMNQKRKARALSSARGGAPFRSVSARRNPMEQRVSGSQIQHLTFILSPATPYLLKRGIP